MKFRVERDVLADAAAWVARSLPARPPVPVLGGVLVEASSGPAGERHTVSGFDYETSARVELDATIGDPGRVLVSGRLLADITRSLPASPVDLAVVGPRATINAATARFTLPTMPVEDYPPAAAMPGSRAPSPLMVLAADGRAGRGRGRPGRHAPDAHRDPDGDRRAAAHPGRHRPLPAGRPRLDWTPDVATVHRGAGPGRTLADVSKTSAGAGRVELALSAGDGMLSLAGGGRRTTVRLLDVEFVKYRSLPAVLAHHPPWTSPSPSWATRSSGSRWSPTAAHPCGCRSPTDHSRLTAGGDDEGRAEEDLPCELEGAPLTIAFNPGYLLDALGRPARRARPSSRSPRPTGPRSSGRSRRRPPRARRRQPADAGAGLPPPADARYGCPAELVHLRRLAVTDYRSWATAEVPLQSGVNVLVGRNGTGKTNLVEALGYLATLSSHRVASDAPLIRRGTRTCGGPGRVVSKVGSCCSRWRSPPGGESRADQPGTTDQGPRHPRCCAPCCSRRRTWRWSAATHRATEVPGRGTGHAGPPAGRARADYDRVLKQRNALLKTAGPAGGRRPRTLDVWDEHLADPGARCSPRDWSSWPRTAGPHVAAAYADVAGSDEIVDPWCTARRFRFKRRTTGPEPAARPARAMLAELLTGQKDPTSSNTGASRWSGRTGTTWSCCSAAGPAKGYASHGESWSFALALRLECVRVAAVRRGGSGAGAGRRVRPARRPPRPGARRAVARRAEQVLVTAAVDEDVPEALDGVRYTVGDGRVVRRAASLQQA